MTQNEYVLDWLKHYPITQAEATQHLGITRLASRIDDLKKDGWDIVSVLIPVENRHGQICHVAQYRLRKEEQAQGMLL